MLSNARRVRSRREGLIRAFVASVLLLLSIGAPSPSLSDRLASTSRMLAGQDSTATCDDPSIRTITEQIARLEEGSEAERTASIQLDRCIQQRLGRGEDAGDLVRLARELGSPRLLAKIELMAAMRSRMVEGDCTHAHEMYVAVRAKFQGTMEAERATVADAMGCQKELGGPSKSIELLERAVPEMNDRLERAWAMYQLGRLYLEQQRRDDARGVLQQLIEDYPETLEYPSTGGMRIVEFARTTLREAERYKLSPLLDQVLFRLSEGLGWERRAGWVTIVAVESLKFVVRVGGLSLVIACVCLVAARKRPEEQLQRLFRREWSIWRIGAFLASVWLFALGYCMVLMAIHSKRLILEDSLWKWQEMGLQLGTAALMIGGSLSGESWSKVMGLRRRVRLGRLALVLFGLLVIYLTVSGMVGFGISRVMPGAAMLHGEGRGRILAGTGGPGSVLLLIAQMLLAVVAEECVYRGVVFEGLSRYSTRNLAAVLSSFLYAVSHVGGLGLTITLGLHGLLAVYLRERFGGLWPAIAFHFLVNVLVLVVRW